MTVVYFTVHEKSILLPLLPASFLALEEPFIYRWFVYHAMLSMFPLLRRDKLVLPYAALYGLFILFYQTHTPSARKDPKKTDFIFPTLKSLVFACSLVLHIIFLTITPTQKYPFLFEAIIMLLCCSQFLLIFMYSNTKQWMLTKLSATNKKSL